MYYTLLSWAIPGSSWFAQMRPKLTSNDWAEYDCEHLVFAHDHFSAAGLREAVKLVYGSFYQTSKYARRVERFLAKYPRYERSFAEFQGALEEAGYISATTASADRRCCYGA